MERLRGFDFRRTDGQTDICNCRVAFATENQFFYEIYGFPEKWFLNEVFIPGVPLGLVDISKSGGVWSHMRDFIYIN